MICISHFAAAAGGGIRVDGDGVIYDLAVSTSFEYNINI